MSSSLHRGAALFSAIFLTLAHAQSPALASTVPTPVGAAVTRGTAPYSYVGRISASFGPDEYIATGTVIRPHSVLTCAHILWDTTYGWAYNVYFERAFYNGTRLGLTRAAHKYVMASYAKTSLTYGSDSDAAFNRDLGAIVFSTWPARGQYTAASSNLKLLNGLSPTMSLGYGADVHSGDELLKCAPPLGARYAYVPAWTNSAYYFNDYFVLEHGMSGGPIFAKSGSNWYVVGVNVSGDDYGMGMHALDSAAAAFIASYMK